MYARTRTETAGQAQRQPGARLTVAGGLTGDLVTLQRAAGNAATTSLLVQRQPKQPSVKDAAKAQADEKAALKKLRDTYTYAYWMLAEAKGVQPDASGAATFLVNGVRVNVLPDQVLTEAEFKAQGESFEVDGKLYAAVTSFHPGAITWDPKSVRTTRVGDSFMVDDYTEPVAQVSIRTSYRKTSAKVALAGARSVKSGYGKGNTLQDHEASHVADAIAYVRANGPRLADGRGMEANEFNRMLLAYFDAAMNMSKTIGDYSRGKTDCPGTRNAVFCPPAKKKK